MFQAEGWDRPRQRQLKAGCLPTSPLHHSAAVAPAWLWGQRCHRSTEINHFYLGLVTVQHKKSPETSPIGPDLIFLSFKFGGGGAPGPAVASSCAAPLKQSNSLGSGEREALPFTLAWQRYKPENLSPWSGRYPRDGHPILALPGTRLP